MNVGCLLQPAHEPRGQPQKLKCFQLLASSRAAPRGSYFAFKKKSMFLIRMLKGIYFCNISTFLRNAIEKYILMVQLEWWRVHLNKKLYP